MKLGPGLQTYCYKFPLMVSRSLRRPLPVPDRFFKRMTVKGKKPNTLLKITPHDLFASYKSLVAANDTYPVPHSQGHSIACITKEVYSILVQQVL